MRIDAATRFALLLGHPVHHSLSPRIHNAAFQAQGIGAVYLAVPVAPSELAAAVEGLRALRCLGASVTLPHKQAMLDLVDALTPQAEAIGAVNTLVFRDEAGRVTILGDNTDVAGFLEPLHAYAERLHGSEMLVFGAGGAARAVVYGLLTAFEPSRLTLAVRSPAKAERLADDLAAHDTRNALRIVSLTDAAPAVRTSRLLVNATPLGMHPEVDGTPWASTEDVGAEQIAYDLVYNPVETRFLREAAARGATPIGGLGMLIGQAAAAYVQWTGQPMPVEAVRAALHDFDA